MDIEDAEWKEAEDLDLNGLEVSESQDEKNSYVSTSNCILENEWCEL